MAEKKTRRGPGKPWPKGKSANPSGRPKGIPNKATVEVRELARRLVEDPDYLALLKKRLAVGKAPHMEPILWYYAFGKPRETVDVNGSVEARVEVVRKLSTDELRMIEAVLARAVMGSPP